MEVGYWQKLLLARLHPLHFGKGLALGTMAVAARVVPHYLRATVVTLGHVTAEQGGAAGFDIAHHAQLTARQMMALSVGLAMHAEDVSNFEPLPCPVPDCGVGTHGLVRVIGVVAEAVKRGAGLPEMGARQVKIAQRGPETLVA